MDLVTISVPHRGQVRVSMGRPYRSPGQLVGNARRARDARRRGIGHGTEYFPV
jgi:hypothetical protein